MELLTDQKLTKRIIVLITDSMVNNRELAYAMHWMAFREYTAVLYMVLVHNNENMMAASRDMATMKAVTAANRLAVEVKLTEVGELLETLRKTVLPGDIILCQEEQMLPSGFFKTIPIRDFLAAHFNLPIRTISGYYHPVQTHMGKLFREAIALFGFLVILAVFTWMQIQWEQTTNSMLAKILVIVTFCIEMSAILAWNKFTYR